MGKVYIVGAGPGDPELLTLKALKVIKEADVILYDRLIGPGVLSHSKPSCKFVYVGKEDGNHALEQDRINELLLESAREYGVIARLKGGDPFVFGRGGEEIFFLAANGIPFEVVPGVSSVASVPAYAGIPVTHRGLSSCFAVITGHEARDKKKTINWEALKGIDTLVFLMGVKNRRDIARKLIEAGRVPEEPAAFIENGTTPEQRLTVTTLGEVATDPPPVSPPAVFLVGEVVRLGEEIQLLSNFNTLNVAKTNEPVLCLEGPGVGVQKIKARLQP